MLELSPAEWTAVALSLRIALVATAWALPFGIAIGWLLARGKFWGKTVLDGLVHLPLVLPPVVTGYLLLIWFGRKGPVGAFLYDHFGMVFAFRWTGAALASGVMGFPLLVRPPTGRCSGDTGRQSCLGVFYCNAAARFARHRRRPVVVLRPRAWRIWRDDHLCLQHSRRNANDLRRDLHIPANSRRRRRGRSAGRGCHRLVTRRAHCRRMARSARQHALSWGIIVLALEVEKQLGAFALAVRFQIAGGVTALFGPSGAGKTSLVNMIAGLLKPDRGCIVLDQTTLFDAAKTVNVPPHRRQID